MRTLLLSLFILTALTLAGCGVIPGLQAEGTAVPLVPSPTPALGSFRQADDLACPIAQFQTVATSEEQGSLVAWSPRGDKIAYLAPLTSHAMFSGNLVVASGENFQEKQIVAPLAWGSLMWSPSGEQIAYVALRPNDNVYTVYVTRLDGSAPVDLFPGSEAALDPYASPKMLRSWPVESRLRVFVACGVGCYKEMEISLPGGTMTEVPSVIQTPDPTAIAGLWMAPRVRNEYDADAYPALNDPNWSPDGSRLVYFDEDGFLWVLLTGDRTTAPVTLINSSALPVFFRETWKRETHWSSNGQLAVRIGAELELFSVPCDPNLSILPTPTVEE
jgi:hypothetical protein